jgi:hypothetical protein
MATTQNTFTGDGSNLGPFSFTFNWLKSTDIKVTVDGVLKTAGTHYNLQALNFTTKTGGQVLFIAGNAPGDGASIVVYRSTDDSQLSSTFNSGSAIRAQDLNDNFSQILYKTQETVNYASTLDASSVAATANTALTNSEQAETTANEAINVANAIAGTANTALANANDAVSTANTATTTANAALSSANGALQRSGGTMTGDITFSGTQTFPGVGGGGDVYLANANAFTGANTFTNATGQTFRQAATQDGVLLRGRSGGTTSRSVEIVPTTLTANRTLTAPDVSGNIVTTGDTGSVTSTMIVDGTIVNADINASAAIAGTKISPDFGSQIITTTGIFRPGLGTASAPTITFTGDTNTGIYSPGADALAITTGGINRFDVGSAGNVNIGTTTDIQVTSGTTDGCTYYYSRGSAGVFQASNTSNIVAYFRRRTTDGAIIQFHRDTTAVGNISVTTTATAYNTSSDYRLKENVVPLTNAISRLQQIPVHRFNFISEPQKTVDGFLAHEAQAVVPESVTGTKDQVDASGNPIYQGIDQAKLVPLLTAALQEAIQRIEALEANLT